MVIEVNNIKINYEIYGNGKPLILLNPNSVNTNYLIPFAKKLSKNYKVYKVDRRCCGKSQMNCDLSYESSAKDIVELIEKLQLDKPYIIGLSGGASVALYLSIIYPDYISKMVLCSGVARFGNMKYPKWAEKVRRLQFLPFIKSSEKFYELNEKAKEIDIQDFIKIKAKTLVINGGQKDIAPEDEARYICDNIENSKLLIFRGYGHCKYIKNCKEFDNELKEFLDT